MPPKIQEMSFDDFVTWATGHIVFGIGSGMSLKALVWEVMNNFVLHWLPSHDWKKVK